VLREQKAEATALLAAMQLVQIKLAALKSLAALKMSGSVALGMV
jgi:hypothetical protein